MLVSGFGGTCCNESYEKTAKFKDFIVEKAVTGRILNAILSKFTLHNILSKNPVL